VQLAESKMSNIKTVKKGEFLFREGEKITNFIFIKTGGVSLCLARSKKNTELFTVGANSVLCEQALSGAQTHVYSALATAETQLMELPVDIFKKQVESSPEILKVLIKSLTDRLKFAVGEIKNSKLEKDSSPCPEDQTAATFAALFHALNHKAEKLPQKDGKIFYKIDWTLLKQYGQRVFRESPKRLEQAINIFVKMKTASFEMGKPIDNPEGPDEIQKVNFFEIATIEAFFEFYQYYYFKGSAATILKYDDFSYNILGHIIKLTDGVEVDRFGVVSLDYTKVIESFKNDLNINLNNNHFSQLEARGIMAKRQSRDNGQVLLQFEIKEYKTTHYIWRILREIEKWNEKGFVDLTEDESKKTKKSNGPTCPQCAVEVAAAAKFCHECGCKLQAVA
jgi:CRP-like cAMP-binding protein